MFLKAPCADFSIKIRNADHWSVFRLEFIAVEEHLKAIPFKISRF